ncbi:hypothetical protein IJG14_07115 [bacterium]|nr:hypothetical protein [bacterium]
MINKSFFQKVLNILFLSCMGLIAIGGVLFLLYFYKWNSNFSFFSDESFNICNSMELSWYQLFLKLPRERVVPPFFSMLIKIFIQNFELKEYIIRLIPLSATILSFLLFSLLLCKIFKNKFSIIVAFLLFIINFNIYQYSVLLKPQTCDILITIIVCMVSMDLYEKKDIFKGRMATIMPLFLGVVSCICFCFSYTSALIIVGLFFTKIIYEKIELNKFKLKPYLIYLIPCLIYFIFFLFFVYIPMKQDGGLFSYWFSNNPCFTVNMLSLNNFNIEVWNAIILYLAFGLVCCKINFIILYIILVFSFILFYRQNRIIFYFFIIEIPLIIVLALLKIYPIGPEKVILFFQPLFCILLTKVLDITYDNKKTISIIAILLYCFMINYNDLFRNIKAQIQDPTNGNITKYFYMKYFYSYLKQEHITSDMNMYYDNYKLLSEDFDVYNIKKIIDKPIYNNTFSDLNNIEKNKYIFFYLYDAEEYKLSNNQVLDYIQKNCKTEYIIEDNTGYYPGKFIKCKKITATI